MWPHRLREFLTLFSAHGARVPQCSRCRVAGARLDRKLRHAATAAVSTARPRLSRDQSEGDLSDLRPQPASRNERSHVSRPIGSTRDPVIFADTWPSLKENISLPVTLSSKWFFLALLRACEVFLAVLHKPGVQFSPLVPVETVSNIHCFHVCAP